MQFCFRTWCAVPIIFSIYIKRLSPAAKFSIVVIFLHFGHTPDTLPMNVNDLTDWCLISKTIDRMCMLDKYIGEAKANFKIASYHTLRRVWLEDFPDVITPRVKRFSHCEICALGSAAATRKDDQTGQRLSAEERIAAKKKAASIRIEHKARKRQHIKRLNTERKELNDAVAYSRCYPDDLFFFEIDSMDSAKTLLPHWNRLPKNVDAKFLLKFHLTCVKYNGTRPDDIYYYTNTVAHDSSTTCSIIWATMEKVRLIDRTFLQFLSTIVC